MAEGPELVATPVGLGAAGRAARPTGGLAGGLLERKEVGRRAAGPLPPRVAAPLPPAFSRFRGSGGSEEVEVERPWLWGEVRGIGRVSGDLGSRPIEPMEVEVGLPLSAMLVGMC